MPDKEGNPYAAEIVAARARRKQQQARGVTYEIEQIQGDCYKEEGDLYMLSLHIVVPGWEIRLPVAGPMTKRVAQEMQAKRHNQMQDAIEYFKEKK